MASGEFDIDKLRSVGFLSRGRTRPRVAEGRAHPDSGEPYKAVTDELGHTVTEHGKAGAGVSDRQDVHIRAETVRATYHMKEGVIERG